MRPSNSRVSLPSATTVPTPVGVKNAGMPAPPARMRSASVPCGRQLDLELARRGTAARRSCSRRRSSTTIFLTWPLASRSPSPLSSTPQLLEMMVRSLASPCGAARRSGSRGCRRGRSRRPAASPRRRCRRRLVRAGDGLVHATSISTPAPRPCVTRLRPPGAVRSYCRRMCRRHLHHRLRRPRRLRRRDEGRGAVDGAAGGAGRHHARRPRAGRRGGRGRAGAGGAAVPAGTIHVAVVDPGVGRRARRGGRRVGGQLLRRARQRRAVAGRARAARRIYRDRGAGFRREPVSPTFHGRDVFAPTAGRLAAGAPGRGGRPADRDDGRDRRPADPTAAVAPSRGR